MSVSVTVNTTPNEHALKFSVNKKILDLGYKTFNSMEEAKDFPVAAKIFQNTDVASIFIMVEAEGVFISVTKKTEANLDNFKDEIITGIKAVL
jgi:hypothetical protein